MPPYAGGQAQGLRVTAESQDCPEMHTRTDALLMAYAVQDLQLLFLHSWPTFVANVGDNGLFSRVPGGDILRAIGCGATTEFCCCASSCGDGVLMFWCWGGVVSPWGIT